MTIRAVTAEDLSEAIGLIQAAIAEMRARNIDQWDEVYPDEATIGRDIQSGKAFGGFEGKALAAYVVLNRDADPEYRSVSWEGTEDTALVMHRLCVHPAFQGKGYASRMLGFAETRARSLGYSHIRLDAFPKNGAAIAMYEKKGYVARGTVTFRKGEFTCYEKALT